ncbi:hypothetical protein PGTUg99_000230 [Puccinia graminis f. sp. tritici]|uniref:Uncharacterized protein n=1 Tax=Puccinia graminis f. sp. tritici TaxID=56615 RepID=A0A5B0LJL6_PUCGR|nr:hypothetical protein PGTUg99_000230 [Puccinia graminis f. sp. tritici]
MRKLRNFFVTNFLQSMHDSPWNLKLEYRSSSPAGPFVISAGFSGFSVPEVS